LLYSSPEQLSKSGVVLCSDLHEESVFARDLVDLLNFWHRKQGLLKLILASELGRFDRYEGGDMEAEGQWINRRMVPANYAAILKPPNALCDGRGGNVEVPGDLGDAAPRVFLEKRDECQVSTV
jgi:hypothetical protein